MAHPMAGQAKSSEKKRLSRLVHGVHSGATGGKAWGSSKMYKKTSYPGTHAGSNTSFTISGGKGKKRADRRAVGGTVGKYAAGGGTGKKKPHHTTNIVIAAPGGAGGHALGGRGGIPIGRGGPPAVVRRPVPVPVRPPIAAAPVGPGIGAPGLGAPGLGAPGLGAVPPRPALPVAPPGAGGGGLPLPGMKRGGAVRKAQRGGAYAGYPHSPTKEGENAVSPHRHGGRVKGGRVKKRAAGGDSGSPGDDDDDGKGKKKPVDTATDDDSDPGRDAQALAGLEAPSGAAPGPTDPNAPAPVPQSTAAPSDRNGGVVKKRQFGGLGGLGGGMDGMGNRQRQPQQQQGGGLFGMTPPGRQPLAPQQGPPTISGRPARPAQPLTVPMPSNLAAYRSRPAPGTMVGFKKGGKVPKPPKAHSDEAEDRALFKRMMREQKGKRK
jgi:hypothetical protein